ncbi:MAG: ABC transporter permease [Hespellia sp.]|nr:ABC transporter permease [Hespellia sp.]
MLKLIQTEFLKLRRKKFVWLMLSVALFMPVFALFYFKTSGGAGIDPIEFYKWTAFSYTPWIILPVVLGILCTMLIYDENQYDMLKQLWIVPVGKMEYFFSKFTIVLFYSVCFMLITAAASVLAGVIPGYIAFSWESVGYLLVKCLEISVLTALAVMPILAVAAAQKGYILPVCTTLVYTFLGFILLMVNMYLHPLSSMTAIVMRDIPGVVLTKTLNIPAAIGCICVWDVASVVLANVTLKKRK